MIPNFQILLISHMSKYLFVILYYYIILYIVYISSYILCYVLLYTLSYYDRVYRILDLRSVSTAQT